MPMPKKTWFEMKTEKDEMEILVHDEIGFYGVTSKDFIKNLKDAPKAKNIHLRINSPGGEVFEGNAIYNALLEYGASIRVTIDSLAASMASVLAMAADPGKITMPENAMYMIHNPLVWIGGDAETLRKYADLLDKLKEGILSAYMRHAKGKTREEMSKIMDSEAWLSAAEAKDIGFADEILTSTEEAKTASDRARVENCRARVMAMTTQEKPKQNEATVPTHKQEAGMHFDKDGNLVDETGKIVKTKAEMNVATAEAHAKEMMEAAAAAGSIATEAERKRITSIQTMCATVPGCDAAFVAALTAPGVSIEQAQAKVMAKMAEALAAVTPIPGGDETDKVRAGLVNTIMVRAGIEKDPKKVAEFRASEMASVFGFQGILRFLGKRAGVANAESCDPGRLFQALLGYDVAGIRPRASMGMNTNDLNSVLSTAANSIVLKGYGDETTTYQRVSRNITLSDLKQADMYRSSGAPDVLQIPEGQPPKLGVISDTSEHARLKKWGRAFSYTEEMAINDRLDMLGDLPYKWGRAIAREMDDRFWRTLLTGNGPALIETGAALFAAAGAFANQAAVGAAISQATLSAGFVAMRRYTRLNPDGGQSRTTRLNLPPRFIITGVRSEWLVRQFTSNVYVPQTTPPASTNMLTDNLFRSGGSMGLEPVIVSLVDDLIPATNGYLLAQDPNIIDYALTLSLAGRETPQTQSKLGGAGEVKGVIFDIEHFFEVAFVDWRGYWKNVGV